MPRISRRLPPRLQRLLLPLLLACGVTMAHAQAAGPETVTFGAADLGLESYAPLAYARFTRVDEALYEFKVFTGPVVPYPPGTSSEVYKAMTTAWVNNIVSMCGFPLLARQLGKTAVFIEPEAQAPSGATGRAAFVQHGEGAPAFSGREFGTRVMTYLRLDPNTGRVMGVNCGNKPRP